LGFFFSFCHDVTFANHITVFSHMMCRRVGETNVLLGRSARMQVTATSGSSPGADGVACRGSAGGGGGL